MNNVIVNGDFKELIEDQNKWQSSFDSENFNISLAEFAAHDLGERLDVVFVLNYEEDKPRFWFVPPEQLPEILDN